MATGEKKRFFTTSKIIISVIIVILVIASLIFFSYVNDYAKAEASVQTFVENSDVKVTHYDEVIEVGKDPANAKIAYLFYPGGKVETESYLPYLIQAAEDEEIVCLAIKPMFRISIFAMFTGSGIRDAYPQIETWVLGGHSLGGVTASSYAWGSADWVSGVILLASYPSNELQWSDMQVLSVTASNDEILDQAAFEDGKSKLPDSTTYVEIEGGNHAGFGSYIPIEQDAEATITPEEQQEETAELTMAFLKHVDETKNEDPNSGRIFNFDKLFKSWTQQ